MVGGLDGRWQPAMLRLVARMFAHEHLRARGAAGTQALPASEPGVDLTFPEGQVIGRSAAMQRLYREARIVSARAQPVLLVGETGVGKEVVARLIHHSSSRGRLPLVEIDCTLADDAFAGRLREVLGEVPGRNRRGSPPGTVLLDEVGALGPVGQVALVGALNALAPVRNGDAASHPRIVATTNLDLETTGAFRRDLWFRLAGFVVRVPALRERVEDVPLLFEHFLSRELGTNRPALSPDALAALLAYPWPGNLRELAFEAARIATGCRNGEIRREDLSPQLRNGPPATAVQEPVSGTLAEALAAAERQFLDQAMQRTRGNLSQAARVLGISRPRLRRRLAAHALGAGAERPPAVSATLRRAGRALSEGNT